MREGKKKKKTSEKGKEQRINCAFDVVLFVCHVYGTNREKWYSVTRKCQKKKLIVIY